MDKLKERKHEQKEQIKEKLINLKPKEIDIGTKQISDRNIDKKS